MANNKPTKERFPDVYEALKASFKAGYAVPYEMMEQIVCQILDEVVEVVVHNKKAPKEGYGKKKA